MTNLKFEEGKEIYKILILLSYICFQDIKENF